MIGQALACLALLLPATLLTTACSAGPAAGARPSAPAPGASRPAASRSATQPRRSVIGRSVQGRPLVALTLGTDGARRRLLVVGCVHGDESAGIRLAEDLLKSAPPASAEVVVVPDANPDGLAAGTRQNAHHVDLNRNFPFQWRRVGRPGDQQYSGTGPLSEPESKAVAGLVRRFRPTTSVWFHQPEGVTDESGGVVAVERRFAAVSGLALRRLPRYPGSATSWQNSTRPGTSAFVVELPRQVSPALATRVGRALRELER